jgi:hypothetical protein
MERSDGRHRQHEALSFMTDCRYGQPAIIVGKADTAMTNVKEFSISANGDRWSLETNHGETLVLHQANEPSGGHVTRTALAAFLEERVGKPEHAALLQILGQSRDEVEDELNSGDTDTDTHR